MGLWKNKIKMDEFMNNLYSKILLNLIKEYSNKIPRSHNIKNKYPETYQLLLIETNFLLEKSSMSQRFWHIKNNTKEIPLCKHCYDNYVNWNSRKNNYKQYCSSACTSYSDITKEKRKKTMLIRYNVEYSAQSKIIQNKRQKTSMLLYGELHPAQSEIIKEKTKKTNQKKYKVDHHSQLDIIKDKHKNTNQKKYGVDYIFQTPEFKSNTKQRLKEKYNVDYGCQVPILPESFILLNNKEYLIDQHHNKELTLGTIADNLKVSRQTVANYLKKYSIKIKIFKSSVAEHEICEFLDSINIEYIRNTKLIISPYELDIYIPEYNVAIEHNGLFWHSDACDVDEKYHLNKTELCEVKGIRLIHIFEDEWQTQQQKCKDTLKHVFGKSEKGVYARNTTIKEISWQQAKDFLNQYHLLNAGICGNYRIGAFNKNDQLIGVMVFGQSNNERGDISIELKRFVTNKKNNPGLGSKMFKYAIVQKDYQEVIAFVDRRWFTGLVKDYIGFEKIGYTKPALWWTKHDRRFHRRFKTKQGLIKDGFHSSMSKRKMLESLGYYRIWDCGKIKLKWNSKKFK